VGSPFSDMLHLAVSVLFFTNNDSSDKDNIADDSNSNILHWHFCLAILETVASCILVTKHVPLISTHLGVEPLNVGNFCNVFGSHCIELLKQAVVHSVCETFVMITIFIKCHL